MQGEPSRSVSAIAAQMRELFMAGAYATGRATLHCHTNLSDGELSPTELIDMAARQGFEVVSITDHDTLEAYRERVPMNRSLVSGSLIEYARQQGITLITGAELTSWWRWHPVHILAYGLDPADEGTRRLCAMTRLARSKRISLRWWPVQAMTVCQLVLALGGVPVLAHPRFYWVNVYRIVRELVEVGGLVGIETEYTYHTHHRRLQCPIWTPERIARAAQRYDLVRTGGADSHGRDLTKYRR